MDLRADIQRPDGVTILAVLAMLAGALLFVMGIAIFSLTDADLSSIAEEVAKQLEAAGEENFSQEFIEQMLEGGIPIMGALFMIFGGAVALTGWGFWTMKSWARMLAIALTALLAIMSVIGLNIIGIGISVLILWYLFTPGIKRVFEDSTPIMDSSIPSHEDWGTARTPVNEFEAEHGVRLTCPNCTEKFTVTDTQRPLDVECPKCGTKGTLKN